MTCQRSKGTSAESARKELVLKYRVGSAQMSRPNVTAPQANKVMRGVKTRPGAA